MSQYTQTPLPNLTWTAGWESGTTAPGYGWRGATTNGHAKAIKSVSSVNGILSEGDSKPATQGGFDTLLVGCALSGSDDAYGETAYYWSSSSGWHRYLVHYNTRIGRGTIAQFLLFSVRCKKDD